jgi:zinc transport system substrate-binding protein
MRWRSVVPSALLFGLFAAACGDRNDQPSSSGGKPTVAVSFYPLDDIVQQVAGDEVRITSLVPAGEEAHEYEPNPRQVGELEDAAIVFFLGGGFQPGVDKAVDALPDSVVRADLLEGIELLPVDDALTGAEGEVEGEELADGRDPHVWLDPRNMQIMAAAVADRLGALDSVDQQVVAANLKAYDAELRALGSSFTNGLTGCATDAMVTSHRAFGYLANAFGLRQVSIAGISPGEEPSAKSLQAVSEFAKDNNVTTIFFEERLPDDLAATVAAEIGAATAVLDPIESPSSEQLAAGETYISLMEKNLAALRSGLGCP